MFNTRYKTAVTEFIGYIIDTAKNGKAVWIEIPKSRIRSVKHNIGRALKHKHLSARGLAKIAGQLVSMTKAVVPTKLMLRNVYRLLGTKKSWSDCLVLDEGSLKDLQWWFRNLSAWNGRFVATTQEKCIQIATDASGLAWGGLLVNTGQQAQGSWEPHESCQIFNA